MVRKKAEPQKAVSADLVKVEQCMEAMVEQTKHDFAAQKKKDRFTWNNKGVHCLPLLLLLLLMHAIIFHAM